MVRRLKTSQKTKRKNGSKKGDESSSSNSVPAKVWQPGVNALEEGEELQFDPSAYNSLHAFHIGWPCLSFDVVSDSLGLIRTEFPHTIYCVTGTQAHNAPNSIGIFKISNISGKRRKIEPSDADTDMDSESSDSDDDEPKAPVFQVRKVFHEGCVNRIRSMTQKQHICATWGDTGHVQIWDVSSHLNAMAVSETNVSKDATTISNQSPLFKFSGHKDEGYAIDWSPKVPGRLLSGDCKSCIYLWEPTSDSTWNVDNKPYVGHTGSVEDLQWCPTDENVFASCSVDKTILIWDTREGKSRAMSIKAHETDVNVISWNRLDSYKLASGSDDGTFIIHDLRKVNKKVGDSAVVHSGNLKQDFLHKFQYHKHPITSIEWSPYEENTLAVSSSDNQLTIWDLSLERDEEKEAEFKAKMQEDVHTPADLPPQLLFVHQGQKDLKEVHWHTQILEKLISTAADGFNIFMPSNIEHHYQN